MTIEKFKEFQKYITETDFTADGLYFYKLYISYYYFTDIERGNEETKLYEGNDFKQVIADYITDEEIEDIYSLRITCDSEDCADEVYLIEFSDTLEFIKEKIEILKERYNNRNFLSEMFS